MNIMMLFSHPWKFGGAETYVLTLSKELLNRGHKVILVSDSGGNRDIALPGAKIYYLKLRTSNLFEHYNSYQKLKQVLCEHNIDIIHAQQRTAAYYAALAGNKMGIPYVITLHDMWHRTPLKAFHGKIFRHVIAVSEYMRQEYITNFGANPERVQAIYNGIDAFKFDDISALRQQGIALRKEFNIKPDDKVATIVGRITSKKGHFDFIDAMAKNECFGVSYKGFVVGSGPDMGRLQERVKKKKLTDKVIFTGFRSDIECIMASSDIVLMPSHREAFGLTAVEAMLAEKPIVAYNVGGLPEVVHDNQTGLLVKPGDIDELAEAQRILLTDDELRTRLGEQGRMVALSKFTAETMVRKTEALYKEIIH